MVAGEVAWSVVQARFDDGGTETPLGLASEMGRVARALQAQDGAGATLAAVVGAAVGLVPGASAASIGAVVGRHRVEGRTASSLLAEQVGAVLDEVGEGPCLQAVVEQRAVRVTHLAREDRWPRFTARAAALGAAGMLSLPLTVRGETLGVLTLLSGEPGAFTDDSEQVGSLLAGHAAVAFAGARRVDALSEMARTRDLIGQAKGILMERHRIGSDEAFEMLARASQTSHRKLRDVADELCLSGRLPPG